MLFHRDTLARRNKRNVPIPEGIDWSKRADPLCLYDHLGNRAIATHASEGIMRGRDAFAAQNATFMRQKLMAQNGIVIGYHGTSSANAERIMTDGFKETYHRETGRIAVSAWDEVVAHEALRFAKLRSEKEGALDDGSVIQVRMQDPHEDNWHGRLEWLANPTTTEPLQVYSAEAFRLAMGNQIGKMATIHTASQGHSGRETV